MSSEKKMTGENGSSLTYNGILIPFGQYEMHGVYRLITKVKGTGEYIVTEGSNSYYRTISSNGNLKWWSGKTLISSEF